MQRPRSVRLARLSAMIVLFILSSVSVGYVAVRVMADRDLPADNAEHAVARASTHSAIPAAARDHVSSPFMAYGASAASARIADDGDADDYLVASTALVGTSTTTYEFAEGGGNRNFTGSTKTTTRSRSSSGGGFAAGGNIGAGVGAYGGVSGTSPRKNTTVGTKTSVAPRVSTRSPRTSSTSPSRSSNSSGNAGSSNGGSTDTGAVAGAAVTATGAAGAAAGGVVALGVTGKVGASGSSPSPTPEPISLFLIGSGLCGAFGVRRLFS